MIFEKRELEEGRCWLNNELLSEFRLFLEILKDTKFFLKYLSSSSLKILF